MYVQGVCMGGKFHSAWRIPKDYAAVTFLLEQQQHGNESSALSWPTELVPISRYWRGINRSRTELTYVVETQPGQRT